MSFRSDFAWSRRFLPALKRIAGEYLIGEAPREEDTQRNTDLIVLEVYPKRVGCRVRRHTYWAVYGDQFTIRCDRPNGAATELEKVMAGFGDYLLYGFADPTETRLLSWFLGDLGVFRLWLCREMAARRGMVPGTKVENHDESSSFRAFDLERLPPSFVIARDEG